MTKSLFLPLFTLIFSRSKKAKIPIMPSFIHQRKDKTLILNRARLRSVNNWECEWWLTDTEQWLINLPRLIPWEFTNNTINYLENLTPLPLTSNSLDLQSKICKMKSFWSISEKKTLTESTVLIRFRPWKTIWEKYTQEKWDMNTCMFIAKIKEIFLRPQFKNILRRSMWQSPARRKDSTLLLGFVKISVLSTS